MPVVTHHGEQRVRNRLGLPKRTVAKLAEQAWLLGGRREDFRGSMRRYLDAIYHQNGSQPQLRIWNGFVFVFNDGRLITGWRMHHQFQDRKPKRAPDRHPKGGDAKQGYVSEASRAGKGAQND